jgi:FKBP-type peptidyl-prolyl cis-trans isomerase
MHYFIAFICCMAVFNRCHADISENDRKTLDVFFHLMIENSEVGYVLEGVKPVCGHGFFMNDIIAPNTPSHMDSVALMEGIKTLKKLNIPFDNISIIAYENTESAHKTRAFHEVVFINKKAFLKVVEDNLILFQNVLGPFVTPQALLDRVTESRESFQSILKHDQSLIGILFGFGTQNSIHYARLEQIQEALVHGIDRPPYQSKFTLIPEYLDFYKEETLLSTTTELSRPINMKRLSPSFGFSTLKEEHQALSSLFEISSPRLNLERPPFIFGAIKGLPENKHLISNLEKAQRRIQKSLNSPHFLDNTLRQISKSSFILPKTESMPGLDLSEQLTINPNHVIAKSIWKEIADLDSEYLQAFLKGYSSEKENHGRLLPYVSYKECLKNSRINLQQADQYFSELAKDDQFTEIYPAGLYYKVLSTGNGPVLKGTSTIYAQYTIYDPRGLPLSSSTESIELMKTIPGFYHGVQGMKVGEEREIFIHPQFAYGIYTLLEKGIHLKASVKLLAIENRTSKECPQLNPLDFSILYDSNYEKQLAESYCNLAEFEGFRISQHIAKMDLVDRSKVLTFLEKWRAESQKPEKLSPNEMDLLNQLHWNVYFRKS